MYKVKFVTFCEQKNLHYRDWLSIGYLVSALKKLEDVDTAVSFYDLNEIDIAINDIDNHKSDMIYLTVLQSNYDLTMEFINRFKKLAPSVYIVLGDREASHKAEKILELCSKVDCICIGEAEITLVEIVQRMIKKESLKGCLGLYYKEGNQIVRNGLRPLIEDLDSIDFPDRSYIPQDDHRFGISSSRGCHGHCTFCERPSFSMQPGLKMRSRSMDNFLDEMEMLVEKHNAKYLFFQDDTFCHATIPVDEWYEQLYQGIIKRGIHVRFFFLIRTELLNERTVEKIKKLQTVGLDYVLVGIESGNQEDLKLYGKIARLNQHVRAIKLLQENNILFDYGFIMFNPYSDFEKLNQNLDFLENNNLPVFMEDISKRILMFSGSPIVKKLKNDALLTCDFDLPITNPIAYKFRNQRVYDAWEALHTVWQFPCSRARFMRTVSLYFNGLSVYGKDPLVQSLKEGLDEYEKQSSILSINLARKVFKVAEEDQDNILCALESDFNNSKKILFDLWNKVEKKRLLLAARLKRRDKLYI